MTTTRDLEPVGEKSRTRASVSRTRRRSHQPKFRSALPFLAPALLLYGVFLLYPMVAAVYQSFFEWNGFPTSPMVFVGLDNYVRLFTEDPVFWTAFSNTVVWVVLSMIVPTLLGLVLAIGLNRRLLGRNVMRSMFYVPAVLAPIAIATMWRWMYNPTLGLFNKLLTAAGLEELKQQWLGNPDLALYSIFIAFVWQIAGFNMVLFLAGLQTVPHELLDAAKVDGASWWGSFRHVTLPALRPTNAVVFVLTIIHSLKVFELIVGMTGGGPAQETQVLALWSYTQSFGNHSFGDGNAVATVLLVITLALVVPYLLWTMKESREQ